MGSRRPPPPSIEGLYSLKIDNISYQTTPKDLRRLFERYGDIGDIHIPRDRYTKQSKGFGFVRYYSRRDAEYAMDRMDGRWLDGREIRVGMARYERPIDERGSGRSNGSYRGARRSRTRSRSPRRRRSHSRSRSGSRDRRRSRSSRRTRSKSGSTRRSNSPAHRSTSPPHRPDVANDECRSRSGSETRDSVHRSKSLVKRSPTPRRTNSRSRSRVASHSSIEAYSERSANSSPRSNC